MRGEAAASPAGEPGESGKRRLASLATRANIPIR